MRTLAVAIPRGHHRATDCAVIENDRPAVQTGNSGNEPRPLLPASQTPAHSPVPQARATVSQIHDDILDKLPDDFVRRMRNWARTVDGTSVATSKLQERVDHTRQEHPIPTMHGEADDTHRAVLKLDRLHQEVLAVFWTHLARDLRWMARATPILRDAKLGPYSFRQTLEQAHERLQR